MAASLIKGNAVVAQSGGPTAVINQSLVGVIEGLRGHASIGRIYGARHGVKGMVEDQFIDLTDVPQDKLDAVAGTPSAALGSSRDKPDSAYCERIVASLKKRDIRYFFYIGGNDSSDTCRIVYEMANAGGYELHAMHVPKTIDNDLMENDHTPGFASAARYVAMAFMGDNLDNKSLPGIKINVIMGRHAGFLTAASALLRETEDDGPHLICMPEVPFVAEQFFDKVADVYARHKRCLIAVSEGIQNKDGVPVLQFIGGTQETDAHGNIRLSGTGELGDTMARMIGAKLTKPGGKAPRVRADTLGYAQRYWPDPSPVDAKEAREVGRKAAAEAMGGAMSGSIAIRRVAGPGSSRPAEPYKVELSRVELTAVAAKTRHLPPEFIKGEHDVSKQFIEWARPLVGPLPRIGRL